MAENCCAPTIAIAIGGSSRFLHLYITDEAAALDAPSTITRQAAPLADLAGFAATTIAVDAREPRVQSRLVLVDSFLAPGGTRRSRGQSVHGSSRTICVRPCPGGVCSLVIRDLWA